MSFCKLWNLLYAHCSSDGKGNRWKRDQQLRSNSGLTLYREVSATQGTDPWCNPSSPIALWTILCNMLVAVSLSICELVQTWDNGWEIHSSKDGATGGKGPATARSMLYQGVSATSYRSQSRSFVPNCTSVLVTGVPLFSSRLRPAPRRWYCVRCRLEWTQNDVSSIATVGEESFSLTMGWSA